MHSFSVALDGAPADLLERLAAVLERQGSPTVTARQDGSAVVFQGGWSELTLRSSAADALTAAWPGWRRAPASERRPSRAV